MSSRKTNRASWLAAAKAVLQRYDLKVPGVRFIADYDCVVHRVALAGHRFASTCLRFYPEDYGSIEYIEMPFRWLEALAHDTELLVPAPIRARDGSLVQTLDNPIEGIAGAVLVSWVEGRSFWRGLHPSRMEQPGVLTATLHQHARSYADSAAVPRTRRTHMPPLDNWISRESGRNEWFDARQLDVLGAAAQRLRTRLHAMPCDREHAGVIHGDLHLEIVLFQRGRAGAFDFDDFGWGHFVLDMASTLVYVKHPPDGEPRRYRYPVFRQACIAGYRQVASMPHQWTGWLDDFIVVRLYILLDWMIACWPSLQAQSWGPRALVTAGMAIQDWLKEQR